jgi:hypothetical protein
MLYHNQVLWSNPTLDLEAVRFFPNSLARRPIWNAPSSFSAPTRQLGFRPPLLPQLRRWLGFWRASPSLSYPTPTAIQGAGQGRQGGGDGGQAI